MDSVANWVLKGKTWHLYEDWEQLHARKPMGPVVETSFPSAGVPSRAAISSSLGPRGLHCMSHHSWPTAPQLLT